MNQAAIDPSLANLLNLSAAVQQTANPVVPATGQPTVASQMAQQAQQMAQPQAQQQMPQQGQPPAGISNLLPGAGVQAAQMAQQPVTQQQMMAAQQQMQQQMQQMQQMAQQRRPRGMASGGIASLPVDVEMAEGGVVGYAGPEGSYVTPRTYGYAPDYEDARRLGIDLSPYDPPEVRREKLERLAKMREFDEQRKSFGEIPTEASVARDRTLQMAYADPSRARDVVGPDAVRTMSPGRTMAPPMAASNEGQRLAQARSMPTQFDVGISALPALRRASQMVGGQEREDLLAKIAELESQQQSRSMAPSQEPSAPMMGPQVPSGAERQFGEAIAALGRVETPKERSAQEIAAEREALYRSRGIDPDFAKQRLERLQQMEARDQEEAAARAKMVEGRGLENLISRLTRFGGAPSLFRGAAQAQLGMEPIVAAQRQSDESFNLLMRNRQMAANQERSAIEDMQRALADGDIAKAEKSRDTALAARNAKNTAEAEMRGRFAPQMLQAETSAAERSFRESEGAANRANAVQLERMRRATSDRPGETERILAEFNRLKARDPEEAEQYLQSIERIRGLGKPNRAAMTYDQAADNVSKFLDTQAGLMEIISIKKRAKDAGQPEPSLTQIRDMLIQRELQGAGARTSTAPAGGVVRPASQAEFDALPKGARYINPADGKEYIKN